MHKRQLTTLSWVLIALYVMVTIVRRTFAPNLLPVPITNALITFVPLVFFFVHGSLNYRRRDLLIFAAITLVISNAFENISILTGFPFTRYFYTDILGPKLFLVPVLIGPAYLGTGYLAWTISRVISGALDLRLPGYLTFTVPLLAALMMVSWDLSSDPISATVYHAWIWVDGGSYFGVPLGNFLGWLLTTFVFFQIFALYVKARPNGQSTPEQPSRLQSLQAILFYALIAVGYLVNSLTGNMGGTITDPAGTVWRVRDIYAVTGLVAIFTMGVFVFLAIVKLFEVSPSMQNAPSQKTSHPVAASSLTHLLD